MEQQTDLSHQTIGNATVLILEDCCTGLTEDEIEKILATIAKQAIQSLNAWKA